MSDDKPRGHMALRMKREMHIQTPMGEAPVSLPPGVVGFCLVFESAELELPPEAALRHVEGSSTTSFRAF